MTGKAKEMFAIDPAFMNDIYIMDADGSNVRQLTDVEGYDGGPFFSADGSRICWRRFSEDGATAEVFTMKTDGSDVKRLTNIGAMSWAPFFHPSGDYLIFTTNKHGFGNFELYLVRADGQGEPVRVTYTDGFDGLPVFLPDGKRLSWTSTRTAVQAITDLHGRVGTMRMHESCSVCRNRKKVRTEVPPWPRLSPRRLNFRPPM